MTNPTQESLDHVARLNGYRDWAQVEQCWGPEHKAFTAMRLHALDRDKWLAERQPVNWQDNMDFEPSEGAMQKAKDYCANAYTNFARLIDHLEGTAPVKVDREEEAFVDVLGALGVSSEDYTLDRFKAALAKFKELTNG